MFRTRHADEQRAERAQAMEAPIRVSARYTFTVKPIRLTRHARNRMRWHAIAEDLIAQALGTPDWEEPSVQGRVNRWKQVGGRFLRVTCRETVDRIVVISAVFKRQRPKGQGPRED